MFKQRKLSAVYLALVGSILSGCATLEGGDESPFVMFIDALAQGVEAYAATQTQAPAQNFSSSAGAGSSRASASSQNYRTAGHCVSRDRTSSNLGDYLGNKCDFRINVTWITSEGPCRNGCGDVLQAFRERSSVTKAKGQVVHAACEYPAFARNPGGGKWTGGGYTCSRY